MAKLNRAGSQLVYSTYLGGTENDDGNGIAVDHAGQAYVTGSSFSTDFPTKNPLQSALGGFSSDAFVTKLNRAGSKLVYSTYLGGGTNFDAGQGIAVDRFGQTYVTGFTNSTDFPTQNPLQSTFGGGFSDGFVAKLNRAGSKLVYSTNLGGTRDDEGRGIAVDRFGHAYVTGFTDSTDFPIRNPAQQALGGVDAFVAKLNRAGSQLVYSTYLGGTDGDDGRGIAVDRFGQAYVTGETSSTDFPIRNPLQSALGGFLNAFVTKIGP